MFRNTFNANDKYPLWDFENILSLIQMELSLKPNIVSDFFVRFLESTSNVKHFGKDDDRHSYFISEIIDSQRLG